MASILSTSTIFILLLSLLYCSYNLLLLRMLYYYFFLYLSTFISEWHDLIKILVRFRVLSFFTSSLKSMHFTFLYELILFILV